MRHLSTAGRALLVGLLLAGFPAPGLAEDVPAQPIPQNPQDAESVRSFVGRAATARPVRSFSVPQNPFMAPDPDNNIHDDAYMTDAYGRPGPLGRRTKVTSTFHGAECASVSFDEKGRIITICVGGQGPTLMMINPRNLATKTTMPLPPRSGGGTGSGPFNDFSGGGYFYLDDAYRVVTPTNTRQIWVIGVTSSSTGPAFEVQRMYDLSGTVAPGEGIVSALPDWNGLLWFVTTRGQVGTVDPESGDVKAVQLDGEVIANSFAVDETGGVFVVSDHALYRFDSAADGAPLVTWRRTYQRGTEQKPGQVSQGSGTTPTLIGRNLVAITDNAEPRMHVVVYVRGPETNGAKVCAEPVFAKGESATDNSLIAIGRSVIVENNYGYSGPTATEQGGSTSRGLARVSFSGGRCTTVWTSKERAPSVVPKASLSTGLVYTYTKPPRADQIDPWYFTALDYRTGKTVFKRLAGTGLGYNNNYAPITIGPDGSAYVGALGGLVRLRDRCRVDPQTATCSRS
jgi:hypothetical protein